jgi:hypothetical protein
MNRLQMMLCLAVMGFGSVAGSFCAVLVLAGSTILAEGDSAAADTLTARSLSIVDADGKQRILLNVNDDGEASLILYTADGHKRVQVLGGPESAQLSLHSDTDDESGVALMSRSGGDSHHNAVVVGVDGGTIIGMHNVHPKDEELAEQSHSMFAIMGADGRPRAHLTHFASELSLLGMMNKFGEDRVRLEHDGDEGTGLIMSGGEGPVVLQLASGKAEWLASAHANGMSTIQMKHEDRIRLGCIVRADGRPLIRMLDRNARELWAADPQPDE